MQFTVHLTKEDIVTSKIGLHYQITPEGIPIVINFTPEAIAELVNDYNAIRKEEKEERRRDKQKIVG